MAQLGLFDSCCRRATAEDNRDLKLAWTDVVLQMSGILTRTTLVLGALERTRRPLALPIRLRLPRLPQLPRDGGVPPPQHPKTTSNRLSREISGLAARVRRPTLKIKPKGGAPRDNRNARKSGCHTSEFREFRQALSRYRRDMEAPLAPLRLVLPRPRKRVFYEIVRPDAVLCAPAAAARPPA